MSGIGRGTGVLKIDGKEVATQTMDRTIPLTLPIDETFDIGDKTRTPIDDNDYQAPFTGTIDNNLTISVEPPVLTPDDLKETVGSLSRRAGRELTGRPKQRRPGEKTSGLATDRST
jgi:hypothetical protein